MHDMSASPADVRPGPQTPPDPNVCPYCGASDTIRELGRRWTFQPVTLALDERGAPEAVAFEKFDCADDVDVTGYDCAECLSEWTSLASLGHEQRVFAMLAEERDHYERRAARLVDLADVFPPRLDADSAAERIADAAGRAEGLALALRILRNQGSGS